MELQDSGSRAKVSLHWVATRGRLVVCQDHPGIEPGTLNSKHNHSRGFCGGTVGLAFGRKLSLGGENSSVTAHASLGTRLLSIPSALPSWVGPVLQEQTRELGFFLSCS